MEVTCMFDSIPVDCTVIEEYEILGNPVVEVEYCSVKRTVYRENVRKMYRPINLIDFPLPNRTRKKKSIVSFKHDNFIESLNRAKVLLHDGDTYHRPNPELENMTIQFADLSYITEEELSSLCGSIYNFGELNYRLISVQRITNTASILSLEFTSPTTITMEFELVTLVAYSRVPYINSLPHSLEDIVITLLNKDNFTAEVKIERNRAFSAVDIAVLLHKQFIIDTDRYSPIEVIRNIQTTYHGSVLTLSLRRN